METLMTIDDVAEKTQISVGAVRKYVFYKTIPFLKLGGAIRFRPSEIEKWFKEKSQGRIVLKKGV
jgi:excisionase family DNA binding protein